MGDLTINFSRSEFACKCGCGKDTVDCELLLLCEEVRQINGNTSLTPNCGHRCKQHNTDVGGVDNSAHLDGRAADLPVDDPEHVYDELNKRYPGKYGFGVYKNFIHIDVRTNGPARWWG